LNKISLILLTIKIPENQSESSSKRPHSAVSVVYLQHKWICGLWFVVCGLWFVVGGWWFLVPTQFEYRIGLDADNFQFVCIWLFVVCATIKPSKL